MPVFIRKGELVVGQRAAVLGGRSVYPEFNLHGLQKESTPQEIWDYWYGRNMDGMVKAAHPARLSLAEKALALGVSQKTVRRRLKELQASYTVYRRNN